MTAALDNLEKQFGGRRMWRNIAIGFVVFLVVDLLALTAAIIGARVVRWGILEHDDITILLEWGNPLFVERIWLFGIFAVFLSVIFAIRGHYTRRRIPIMIFNEILFGVLLVGVMDFASAYLLQKAFPRLWVVFTWVSAPFFLLFARYLVVMILKKIDTWKLPVIFIGDLAGLERTHILMVSEQFSGYRLQKSLILVNEDEECRGWEKDMYPIKPEDVEQLKLKGAWRFLICCSEECAFDEQDIANTVLRHGHHVMLLPSYLKLPVFQAEIEPIFGAHFLLMRMQNSLDNWFHKKIKRVIDVVSALILLSCASPVLFAAAIWIKCVSRGDILYRQKRVGYGGENFTCLKLRTMHPNAQLTLVRWKVQEPELWKEYEDSNNKLSNDPRLLRGAAFLRKYSIDELPQLINVLKGDMSLVGPRPIVPRERKEYGPRFENYIRTLPGLTGLWQVNGRSQTTFEKRVELDSWYIQNWSLWLDIIITFKTFKIILLGMGERK